MRFVMRRDAGGKEVAAFLERYTVFGGRGINELESSDSILSKTMLSTVR